MFESSEKPDKGTIAASLRRLRRNTGMTLRDVANAIGATHQAVHQFENGTPALGKDKIARLPAVFGCQSLPDMVEKARELVPTRISPS